MSAHIKQEVTVKRLTTFTIIIPSQACRSLAALQEECTMNSISDALEAVPFPPSGQVREVRVFVLPPPSGWVLSISIFIVEASTRLLPPIDKIVQGAQHRLQDFANKRAACAIF